MIKNVVFLFIVIIFLSNCLFAQNIIWPVEIPINAGGKIIVYQPQPDELTGNVIKGHAAIGVREKSTDELVFGVIFYQAFLFTDKVSRIAQLDSLIITNAKFTSDDENKIQKLIKLLQNEAPTWDLKISLDQIAATLRRQHPDYELFNNSPPKIIYRNIPSSLVILDGEPKVQIDKDLDAERVINSPYLIFKEGKQWNLYVGGIWYKSSEILIGWSPSTSMSKKVNSINTQIKKQEKEKNEDKNINEKPEVTEIIVTTSPAELIQTDGNPDFKNLEGTSLQYASNTANDILKTIDGTIFILIAGRWYTSSSLNGPWVFNESDKLPTDFSKIPEGSPKDNVLVSVSGTEAAEDAIINAEIPQTAKVDRKTATITVLYDGNPVFEAIESTNLELVANSNHTVLKEQNGSFFALDNGIWFISSNSKGPWAVAERRPADIDKIPAKSAAYNSKYVFIYEVAQDYVIMGYTGGYLNNFIQGDPTIIFGTGFYYRPWFGSIYYPRPTTWGFGFHYNPWTGWNINFGFNIGFLHFGFGIGGGGWYGNNWGIASGGGWFGPPLYRPIHRPPYWGEGGYYGNRPWQRPGWAGGGGYYGNRPGNRPNNIGNNNNINININNNNNNNNLYRPVGNKPGNSLTRKGISNRPPSRQNKFENLNKPDISSKNISVIDKPVNNNRPAANKRPINKPIVSKKKPLPSSEKNNVFTDSDGNIFQRDDQGKINQRDNNGRWNKPSNSFEIDQINRDFQRRNRSNINMQNYNRNRLPSKQLKPTKRNLSPLRENRRR